MLTYLITYAGRPRRRAGWGRDPSPQGPEEFGEQALEQLVSQ